MAERGSVISANFAAAGAISARADSTSSRDFWRQAGVDIPLVLGSFPSCEIKILHKPNI